MDMGTEQSSIISKFGTWLFIVDIRSIEESVLMQMTQK